MALYEEQNITSIVNFLHAFRKTGNRCELPARTVAGYDKIGNLTEVCDFVGKESPSFPSGVYGLFVMKNIFVKPSGTGPLLIEILSH